MRRPTVFVEEGFRMESVFLPEKLHKQFLSARINVCVDVVVVDANARQIFLARRNAKPAEGLWWWMGGGMRVGEMEGAGAARVFERETRLKVSPERFRFLEMHRALWKERQEEPQDAGRDDLTYMMTLALHPEERELVLRGLDRGEYNPTQGLHAFDRAGLVAAAAHPLVLATYDQIFP